VAHAPERTVRTQPTSSAPCRSVTRSSIGSSPWTSLRHQTRSPTRAGYHSFSIIDQIPVFIYDPDPTSLTGTFIGQCVDAQGITHDSGVGLPEHSSWYRTIFVCLGIFPNNQPAHGGRGAGAAEFLDNGGRLYMEGGDPGPSIPRRPSTRTSTSAAG